MFTTDLPFREKSLSVKRRDTRIFLSDEGAHPFTLTLPPVEDLQEIDGIRASHTALNAIKDARDAERIDALKEELERARLKLDKFSDSPIFLNRLANLASVAGEYAEEANFLNLARAQADDDFFAHRVGDNLVAQADFAAAEKLFASLDLESDLYANLRLAMFLVQRKQFDEAMLRVNQAVSIDPTSYAARLFEGGLSLVRADFQRAVHAFRMAANEKPASTILFANLAVAYVGMGDMEKALSALRKSVALGPLNANAVCLLADLAFQEGRDEDAVPALRYFVQFEHRRGDVWSRLARACLRIGRYDEAVVALKREAAFGESRGIWNNLGVAYRLRGDLVKSQQAFKQALDDGPEPANVDFFIAARNMAQLLNEIGKPEDVESFARAAIAHDTAGIGLSADAAADLYAHRLHALRRLQRWRDAERQALEILENTHVARGLVAWTIAFLAAQYTLIGNQTERAIELIQSYRDVIDGFSDIDLDKKKIVYNNVAFALAEAGQTELAEHYLTKLPGTIHKDPYPTATLGLIHFRRGNHEKAVAWYEEAIRLAVLRSDKARIRQKMQLELGRYLQTKNPTRARQLLLRAARTKDGDPGLTERAEKELALIPGR